MVLLLMEGSAKVPSGQITDGNSGSVNGPLSCRIPGGCAETVSCWLHARERRGAV